MNEERAWNEYLAWTRGAIPSQYELTEERAWSRLQRDVIWLRLRPYSVTSDSDADESNHKWEEGRIVDPSRPDRGEGQWQRWSEGWEDELSL